VAALNNSTVERHTEETMNAQEQFQHDIVGGNIMTPTVLDYAFTEDGHAAEFSQGHGFDNHVCYAVSVVLEHHRIDTDRSRLFNEGTLQERQQAAGAYWKVITGFDPSWSPV